MRIRRTLIVITASLLQQQLKPTVPSNHRAYLHILSVLLLKMFNIRDFYRIFSKQMVQVQAYLTDSFYSAIGSHGYDMTSVPHIRVCGGNVPFS